MNVYMEKKLRIKVISMVDFEKLYKDGVIDNKGRLTRMFVLALAFAVSIDENILPEEYYKMREQFVNRKSDEQ